MGVTWIADVGIPYPRIASPDVDTDPVPGDFAWFGDAVLPGGIDVFRSLTWMTFVSSTTGVATVSTWFAFHRRVRWQRSRRGRLSRFAISV